MIQVMSWKRAVIWILLALAGVLGLGFVWLFHADLGRFERTLEGQVLSRTGAQVDFRELSIELGPGLRIAGAGLTVENPGWPTASRVLSMGRFEVLIDLGSLFDDDPIQVLKADIDGLQFDLRRDAAGHSNLAFRETEPGRSDVSDGPPVPVLIRQGDLGNARLAVHDAARDRPVTLTIDHLSLLTGDDGMLAIDFTGAVNDRPARYQGNVGPFDALMSAGKVTFNGTGRFDTLDLQGEGVIDTLSAPHRPDVHLTAAGPDIRDLERMLGLSPGKAGAYRLEFHAAAGDPWNFGVQGSIGQTSLNLEGKADGLQSLEQFDLSLQANGPDLGAPLRLLGVRGAPADPFVVRGAFERDGDRFDARDVVLQIGDTTLDLAASMSHFPHARDGRLSLHVSGPDLAAFRELLELPGIAQGPFELKLELQPRTGHVDIISGHASTTLGTMELSGTLTEDANYVGSEATLHIAGDDAGQVLNALAVPGFGPEPFALEVELAVADGHLHLPSARLDGVLAATLELSGDIDFPPMEADTRLQLRLVGEDLADSLRRRGIAWRLGSGAFDLAARLTPEQSALRLDGLQGTVGSVHLDGTARIPLEAGMAGLDVTLAASGPSLAALLADSAHLEVADAPWRLSGRMRREPGRLAIEHLVGTMDGLDLTGAVQLPWPAKNGTASFQVQAAGPDLARSLPRIGPYQPARAPFDLDLDGETGAGSWRFDPSHLQVADARIELAGSFNRLPDFDATDLRLEVTAPDLSALGHWNDDRLPSADIGLLARLTGSHTDLGLEQLRFTTGESRLEGQVRYSRAGETPLLVLHLTSPLMDLRPLIAPPEDHLAGPASPGDNDSEAAAPTSSESTTPGDGRLIPDVALPLEALASMNADVNVAIDRFETHRRIIRGLALTARLADGAVTLDRYHAQGLIGEMSLSGSLTPVGDGRADVTLDLQAVNLVPVREAWKEVDPSTLPKIDAQGALSARGGDLRSLAASLDGNLSVTASEGQLPGVGLGALDLGLVKQLVSVLIPGYSVNQPTDLRCFATRLQAEQGLVTLQPMVAMSSSRVRILGTGTVNLEDEALNLSFSTTPTRLLSVSLAELVNPFVKIRGTMADPRVEVDPAGTLVYGGVAAATGGLSILAKGLFDRVVGTTKPCERFRDTLREEGAATAQ